MNRSMLLFHGSLYGLFASRQAGLPLAALGSSLRLPSLRAMPRAAAVVLGPGFSRSIQTIAKSAVEYEREKAAALARPLSPFYIYRPQLTSTLSIGFRVAGAALSMLVYAFGVTAALAPMDVTAMVQFIAELPSTVALLGKVVVAAPFTYHFWNGIRHLVWDAGRALSLRGVYRSGYAVLAATVASTLLLVMI